MSESGGFERLERLFHHAVELPGRERREFLDELRRTEPDVSTKLERLLAHEAHGDKLTSLGSLLRGSVLEAASGPSPADGAATGVSAAPGGTVRWVDSGGQSVLVLDDAEADVTIIWLLDEDDAVEGAAQGGSGEVV